MAWESCIVLLNSDSTGSFYTGDIVTGSVILEFKHEQKIEWIDLKVVGECKAQWSRSMPTMPFIRIYSEQQKVLDYNIDIFKELHGKTIQPGIQNFHFHFALPGDLPSSFESSVAKAQYYIKIKGKATYKFKKQKIVPFKVQGNINLNHIDNYLEPIFIESGKFFWNSGKFFMRFKTYKGFAPKQLIPFEIQFINEKKVKITKINVILVQKLKYIVSSGYANDEKNICKVMHTKFSNTVTESCQFGMEIPQTLPSSINLIEPMIDISYVLRVEVIFPFHTTMYKDIPVTVATIPVMHNDFCQSSRVSQQKFNQTEEINKMYDL